MVEGDDLRNYLPRTIVCMVIGILGLAAVPFTGTRFGDFPEMIALAIGVTPILYLAGFALFNINRRLAEVEKRLAESVIRASHPTVLVGTSEPASRPERPVA